MCFFYITDLTLCEKQFLADCSAMKAFKVFCV